ncbi:MAG: CRISPR-associated protein Cse2 family [Chlorobi bacterium]|nr:CRISPR-associated protein Cse2 family [Chlorobiota bacterium]
MTEEPQQPTPESRFWAHLYALHAADNRAALAKLRRGIADPAGPDVYATIGASIPGDLSNRDHDAYLLAACLFALHPTRGKDSLGVSVRALRGRLSIGAESLDQRFAGVLNSDVEDLAIHLRHMIRLLASHEVAVNYPRLLQDICRWRNEDRIVQRRWARDYWSPQREEQDEPQTQEAPAA